MDQDRLIPIPQPQFQNPNPLWDFGSYPERKGEGLLFEKEVLDIQVGKGSKCLFFRLVFRSAKDNKPLWSWSIIVPFGQDLNVKL